MLVIFNADDFGYSKGINLGIEEAYRNGLVRSTTMMAAMYGFDHGVEIAKANPGLKIGAHLTLTTGKSVGGVYKTITDADGNFFKNSEVERKAKAGEFDLAEVEAEYEAQIAKITSAGIAIDHLDGHHHSQNYPGIVDIFLKLAKKYQLKVRIYDQTKLTGEYAGIKTTGVFSESFFDTTVSVETLKQIISGCKAESLEIMCHPAYIDQPILSLSSYNVNRALELQVLTSSELKEFIKANAYTLGTFSDIN